MNKSAHGIMVSLLIKTEPGVLSYSTRLSIEAGEIQSVVTTLSDKQAYDANVTVDQGASNNATVVYSKCWPGYSVEISDEKVEIQRIPPPP